MVRSTKVLSVVILFVVGFAAYRIVKISQDPLGVQLRSEIPEQSPTRPSDSPFSAEYHAASARVFNNFARRSTWTPEDVT